MAKAICRTAIRNVMKLDIKHDESEMKLVKIQEIRGILR